MVLLIMKSLLNGYNWEYTLFSDKPEYVFLMLYWLDEILFVCFFRDDGFLDRDEN